MSTSIDYGQFYRLSDVFNNRALRLRRWGNQDWLDRRTAALLFRGKLRETPSPPRLIDYSGRQPLDFLWTGFPPLRCVSARVVALLEDANLTGWSTYPVEVFDRDGKLLPGYHGFAVTGRAGTFRRELSTITTIEHPWGTRVDVYMGFYFDPKDWDGTDIILVSGSTVVTHRVRQLFTKAKVRNIRFTCLPEVDTPLYMFKDR